MSKVIKSALKSTVEKLSGCHLLRFGARKSFALIDRRRTSDGWFSPQIQLESVLERGAIDLVVDVGANEGQFAQTLRTFYKGEIHSFEPVTRVFESLSNSAKPDTKWHVYNIALGGVESQQTINVSNSTVFSSLLKTNPFCGRVFGASSVSSRTEPVRVRRLDDVLRESVPNLRHRRIFLKMDTQGYDLEVFKGLGDTLDLVIALQSEVSLAPLYDGMPHWTENVTTYERAGFGVAGMFPVNFNSGRVIEYDCLMVRHSCFS